MDFDTSIIIDFIVPDSPSDFRAILFWVLMITLLTIAVIDLRMYLEYRKTAQEREKQQQKQTTTEQIKKSHEKRLSDIVEIRNKVDKIIETNKL